MRFGRSRKILSDMPGRSISYPVSNSYHFQQLAVSIGQFLAEPHLKATGRGLSYEHASVWYFLTEIKCRGDAFSILTFVRSISVEQDAVAGEDELRVLHRFPQ